MRPPSARPTIPLATERGIGAKEFNVGEYLINRTSPVASGGETRIDQYDLMFEHIAIH